MSEVKRYEPYAETALCDNELIPLPPGDCVLASDYDALKAKSVDSLAGVIAANDMLKADCHKREHRRNDLERKASRYLRACKRMHKSWKWLVESEWGDCYGLAPHVAKRTIRILKDSTSALLKRAEGAEEELAAANARTEELEEAVRRREDERAKHAAARDSAVTRQGEMEHRNKVLSERLKKRIQSEPQQDGYHDPTEPHEYHADCPCNWCKSTAALTNDINRATPPDALERAREAADALTIDEHGGAHKMLALFRIVLLILNHLEGERDR